MVFQPNQWFRHAAGQWHRRMVVGPPWCCGNVLGRSNFRAGDFDGLAESVGSRNLSHWRFTHRQPNCVGVVLRELTIAPATAAGVGRLVAVAAGA